MKKKRTVDTELQAACRAHNNLNIFAAVIALMESGLLYSESYPMADRLVQLCKKEQQKCLKLYDAARARASAL